MGCKRTVEIFGTKYNVLHVTATVIRLGVLSVHITSSDHFLTL